MSLHDIVEKITEEEDNWVPVAQFTAVVIKKKVDVERENERKEEWDDAVVICKTVPEYG